MFEPVRAALNRLMPSVSVIQTKRSVSVITEFMMAVAIASQTLSEEEASVCESL